jgi:hypothetical protein
MPGASCDNVASSQDFSASRPSDNQLDWLYRPYLWQVSPSATSDDVPFDILDESNIVDQVLLGMAQTTFHKKYKSGS